MTPEQIEKERVKFERDIVAKSAGLGEKVLRIVGEDHFSVIHGFKNRGEYDNNDVNSRWIGWLARAEQEQELRKAVENVLKECDFVSGDVFIGVLRECLNT